MHLFIHQLKLIFFHFYKQKLFTYFKDWSNLIIYKTQLLTDLVRFSRKKSREFYPPAGIVGYSFMNFYPKYKGQIQVVFGHHSQQLGPVIKGCKVFKLNI